MRFRIRLTADKYQVVLLFFLFEVACFGFVILNEVKELKKQMPPSSA
jgi:hypothetical protein